MWGQLSCPLPLPLPLWRSSRVSPSCLLLQWGPPSLPPSSWLGGQAHLSVFLFSLGRRPGVGISFSPAPTPTVPYQTFPEEETPGSPIHQSETGIEIEVAGLLSASHISMCCWGGGRPPRRCSLACLSFQKPWEPGERGLLGHGRGLGPILTRRRVWAPFLAHELWEEASRRRKGRQGPRKR